MLNDMNPAEVAVVSDESGNATTSQPQKHQMNLTSSKDVE